MASSWDRVCGQSKFGRSQRCGRAHVAINFVVGYVQVVHKVHRSLRQLVHRSAAPRAGVVLDLPGLVVGFAVLSLVHAPVERRVLFERQGSLAVDRLTLV